MLRALRAFGQGLLWAVLLPFIAVGTFIVGVFGVVDFVIEFFIMIVNFFRGKKLFPVYPEDQRAYLLLQRAIDKQNGDLEAPAAQQQPVYVQQNFYGTPQSPFPMPPSGSIPQSPVQGQLPPGYQQQLPPGYPQQQLPPVQQQQQLPPYAETPARPELASLPSFDPSGHPKTDSIEIDIHPEEEDER